MKTLSEAVQVAIITEAGSTYRNTLLGLIRDSSSVGIAAEHALKATNSFVNEMIKKAKTE